MITIRELFNVTITINRVEVTVRDADTRLLHRFWFGRGCDREHLPKGLVHEWAQNRLSLSGAKINVHGERKRNGLPETGYGLKDGAIPDELLDAEVNCLHMRCRNGIDYEIGVDVTLPALTVEMLKCRVEGGNHEQI